MFQENNFWNNSYTKHKQVSRKVFILTVFNKLSFAFTEHDFFAQSSQSRKVQILLYAISLPAPRTLWTRLSEFIVYVALGFRSGRGEMAID